MHCSNIEPFEENFTGPVPVRFRFDEFFPLGFDSATPNMPPVEDVAAFNNESFLLSLATAMELVDFLPGFVIIVGSRLERRASNIERPVSNADEVAAGNISPLNRGDGGGAVISVHSNERRGRIAGFTTSLLRCFLCCCAVGVVGQLL